MIDPQIIGFVAAFLTTVAFVPQVVRVIKTHDTHAISLPMYVIFSTGVAMWLVYGVLLESMPMIVANIITLALTLVVLKFKIKEVVAKC